MQTIQFDFRIDALPERVFAALTDLERLTDWRTLESVRLDPPGPVRVGTKIYSKVKGPAGSMTFVNEVTELDAERLRYDDRSLGGTFDIESGWVVSSEGDGTRVRWTTRYQPRGFMRLMSPFLGGMILKGQQDDLGKLASRLGGGRLLS